MELFLFTRILRDMKKEYEILKNLSAPKRLVQNAFGYSCSKLSINFFCGSVLLREWQCHLLAGCPWCSGGPGQWEPPQSPAVTALGSGPGDSFDANYTEARQSGQYRNHHPSSIIFLTTVMVTSTRESPTPDRSQEQYLNWITGSGCHRVALQI